ncbi:MAG: hypothetical protein WBD20_17820, partial [Pirellulaceae bacterium]
MKRWIYAVALVAFCHHPLFAQSESATQLLPPRQMPQLAIAQVQEHGAIEIDLIRPQEPQANLSRDSEGTHVAATGQSMTTRQYEVQVPYVVKTEQQYTVQVPYEVEVVGADGNPKTVTRTREEQRTRIVPITYMRTEKRESKVSVASGKAQVPGSVRASFDVDTKKPPTSSPSVEQ